MRIVAGKKVPTAAGTTAMIAAEAKAKDRIAHAAYLRDTCHRRDSAEFGITTDRQVISHLPATAADYLVVCRRTPVSYTEGSSVKIDSVA
jgi:hypothetical protein